MKSLYSKFIIYTIIIMFMSGLIAFLAVNTFYHQQLKPQNDAKNIDIAKHIASHIEKNEPDLNDFLGTIAASGYKIIVIDEAGEKDFFGADFRKDNLTTSTINSVLQGEEFHGMRDFPNETFVTGFFADETVNTAGVPFTYSGDTYALFLRPDIKMLFTEVHYLLVGMFLVMGIVSVIGMIFLARGLIKPIVKLTEATKQVSEENFTLALPTNRLDEIGQLAKSFHTMAKQMEASDAFRKQFINDFTHDLQTPLQNIQGYAGLLTDDNLPATKRTTYARVIQEETERLSALTAQLLLLTTLDSLTTVLTNKKINISEQIKDTIRKQRWLTDEKGLTVLVDLDDCSYIGDPAFLEKIWDNLFSNACKYSVDDGIIQITLRQTMESVTFTIKDDGIGITAEQIPHLFDRFYRADQSRHNKISGTGLGLAIVSQVVSLYHGKIDVKSVVDEGSQFTITLPLDNRSLL